MRILLLIIVVMSLLMACVPPVTAAETKDMTKAIQVNYQYKDGKITTLSSRVMYGYPPNNIGGTDIHVDLKGTNNNLIGSYGIEDPRILYHEEGADLLEEVTFSVLVPFDTGASTITLKDGQTDTVLATTDVSPAVSSFCAMNPNDPQCGGGTKPTKAPVGSGIAIAALAAIALHVRCRG
ncbi:MAG: hypothetical protein MUF37_02060 [Methanoregulaceae archaeon]|jgi:hypothetical protein|nr:hypothetical protein [Methanoregulaceae archaeon]